MTSPRWEEVKRLLIEALAMSRDQREAYLKASCGGDEGLRREVEELLLAHENAGDFLKTDKVEEIPVAPDAMTRQPARIGPYQILGELGQGGMGSVYLAARADEEYRRQVAIKLIRAGADSDFIVRRFRTERQILAGLSHPNIASLLDGGSTEDGLPFLVMEFIEGEPIDSYCDGRKLTIRERLEIFRTVCGAVQYAHQNLIVHRDIKPGNIFVTKEGVPKLLDFGLAKLLDPAFLGLPDDQTATQVRMMTPAFASPEQIRGGPITTATDVYSLGVLLYLLLTGHRPYRLETGGREELARAVCEQEPTKPSTAVLRPATVPGSDQKISITPEEVSRVREGSPEALRRRLSGDLDTIVLKAMKKDPGRRYASAEQLSADIGRHLEGRPVSARPDTVGYRTRKFLARHRLGVAATVLLVLAFAVAFGQISRERARAERRFDDVRQLAHELIFDLHDAIATLPGSTKARELLVRRAVAYLDRLTLDASAEMGLQREIAAAWEKLGEVQGGENANLGNTAGALESLRKAVAIREAVFQSVFSTPEDRQALARAEGAFGSALGGIGDKTAISHYRRGLDLLESAPGPADAATRRAIAIAHFRIARFLTFGGDFRGALAEKRKEFAIYEELYAAAPTDRTNQRNLALGCKYLGGLLERTGDPAAARPLYERAIVLDEKRAESDPNDAEARLDLSFSLASLASNRHNANDLEGALVYYRRALDLRQAMSAADPANVWARRAVGSVKKKMGEVLADLRRWAESVETHRTALAIFEELSRGDPKSAGFRLDVAVEEGHLGAALGMAASAPGVPASQWQEARAHLQRGMGIIGEVSAGGPLPAEVQNDLAGIKSWLARCDAALAAPRR